MHKTTRLKLVDINPHLQCVLCGGYIIEATTIIECLHSFCRSCITKYLEGSKCCPICDVQVHKTRPLLNLRADKTLQSLVYKLIPGLYKEEMKRRREFFKEYPDSAPSLSAPNAAEERGEVDDDRYIVHEEPETISIILHHCDRLPLPSNNLSRGAQIHEHSHVGSDLRYLLCPAGVSICHLKKFIRGKFDIQHDYQIELFYHSDETLPEDYTLADVAYVYGWTRSQPMRLFYIVLDTREMIVQLPTPTTSAPIIIKSELKEESQSRESKETDVPEGLNLQEIDEQMPEQTDDVKPEVPAEFGTPSTDPVIYPDYYSDQEPSTSKHTKRHKRKKKKKKHKRSKSKEEKVEHSPENRPGIMVRISKEVLSQAVFDDSFDGFTPVATPEGVYSMDESVDMTEESSQKNCASDSFNLSRDGYLLNGSPQKPATDTLVCDNECVDTKDISFLDNSLASNHVTDSAPCDSDLDQSGSGSQAVKDTSLAEFCLVKDNDTDHTLDYSVDSDEDSDSDDELFVAKSKDIEISRMDTGNENSSQHGDFISVHSVSSDEEDVSVNVDESVCENKDSADTQLHTDDSTRINKDNETSNGQHSPIQSSPDSPDEIRQNGSSEHSQTTEYTVELSQKGNKVLGQYLPPNADQSPVAGDVLVEDNPPLIVVVDKDSGVSGELHSLAPESDEQSLPINGEQNGYMSSSELDSQSESCPSANDGTLNCESISMDTTNEKVESPEDTKNAICSLQSPAKPPQNLKLSKKSSETTECTQKKDLNVVLNVPDPKRHLGLPPVSRSADVSATSRVPAGVHSSLSPPYGKLPVKRAKATEAESSTKQAKLSSSSALTGGRNNGMNTFSSGYGFGTPKQRVAPGVHSSLSPPDLLAQTNAWGEMLMTRGIPINRSLSSTTAHLPISEELVFSSAMQYAPLMSTRPASILSQKKSPKRGPLKERPVTLPDSRTIMMVKPCTPAPKPHVYGHYHDYQMLPPALHPPLSAMPALHPQPQTYNPAVPMKQLRLLCGEMGIASSQLATHPLAHPYMLGAPTYIPPNSRHFLSPIFSPPLNLASPLSPTRASPLSPSHFTAMSPAHFTAVSPPGPSPLSPSGLPGSVRTSQSMPGYDAPLELTTSKTRDRLRESAVEAKDGAPH